MTPDLKPGLRNRALDLTDYLVDAPLRGFMFLDLRRRRGNEEMPMYAYPAATVLRFAHEKVMNGRALARPMNYSLLRILAPRGQATVGEPERLAGVVHQLQT
jgi:hypothetical protein